MHLFGISDNCTFVWVSFPQSSFDHPSFLNLPTGNHFCSHFNPDKWPPQFGSVFHPFPLLFAPFYFSFIQNFFFFSALLWDCCCKVFLWFFFVLFHPVVVLQCLLQALLDLFIFGFISLFIFKMAYVTAFEGRSATSCCRFSSVLL
jgi:hypothetical protein